LAAGGELQVSKLDQQTVDLVIRHAAKGHKVLLGHSHHGHYKIKVKYGPFGVMTARFSADLETFEEIKFRLRELYRAHKTLVQNETSRTTEG